MILAIEDLNGEQYYWDYVDFKTTDILSIQTTKMPRFYDENHPDGLPLGEKVFSEGVVINGLTDVSKGYISFTVNTQRNTPFGLPISTIIIALLALFLFAVICYPPSRRKRKRK